MYEESYRYAKLLSTQECLLIHPVHVLLNVWVKVIIWALFPPLYKVSILYAVRGRSARRSVKITEIMHQYVAFEITYPIGQLQGHLYTAWNLHCQLGFF